MPSPNINSNIHNNIREKPRDGSAEEGVDHAVPMQNNTNNAVPSLEVGVSSLSRREEAQSMR